MKKLAVIITLCLLPLNGGALISGSTTCPSSGAKQVLAASHKTVTYVVQADINNGGYVCLGGPNITTSTGPCLASFQSASGLPQGNSAAYDLNTVWMACTVNTDVVKWSYQ